VQRYDFETSSTDGFSVMVPREEGEWVRFEDHEAEIARLRDDLARANESGDRMFADLHETRRELNEWRNG